VRLWKSKLALTAAATAVLALPATLFIRHGVIDALTMVLISAALVGNYLIRRYARAELLYHRPSETSHVPADRSGPTGSGCPGAVAPRADQPTSVPDRQAIPAGASVRCQ
jgi:hypothetical protein